MLISDNQLASFQYLFINMEIPEDEHFKYDWF
jgi:hypothetical protein